MIDPAIIDAMVAAGATAEVIAAAVRADHVISQAKASARRERNRDRMRVVRAGAQTSAHNDAQTRTKAHRNPPSKVPPITPLNTPQDSEPIGSAAGAAPAYEVEIVGEDPKAKLFRIGKTVLVSFGVAERRTGSLIGQWLKSKNDPVGLLAAIQFARDQNVAEPVAYVSAIVSGKGKQNGGNGALASAADDLIARRKGEAGADGSFTLDLTVAGR